jgi:hypothetical protein
MQSSTLLPPSPHPRANAFEVFKADRPLRAFGSLNQAFADRMVHILGKAALLTSKLLQSPSRRFGAKLLEFGAQPPMAITHLIDPPATSPRLSRATGRARNSIAFWCD